MNCKPSVHPLITLFSGKDADDLSGKDIRSMVRTVSQDVFLFSESIYKNIVFGLDEHEKEGLAHVYEVSKTAEVYDNIIQFKEGFDTLIGERGVTLSGGQKQRISIARALIKNPQVLLLDDCLSAVDTQTESKIIQNFKTRLAHKLTIYISHRINTIQHAEQIIVLGNGAISEKGTHDELIALKGDYFQQHQSQLMAPESVH